MRAALRQNYSLDHNEPQHHLNRMLEAIGEFWDDHLWAMIALIAAITVFISVFAERRRSKRARIENVGFMPWIGITVICTLIAVSSIALAIKTEFAG